MTFARKRSDTLVSTIERQYGIDLHARSDMTLGGLLRLRGFGSWSEFLQAHRGRARSHARRRRVFLSFHAEDLRQVGGFRLMIRNPNVDLTLFEPSAGQPVFSEQSTYIRRRIRDLIDASEVLVCLIGNGTAWRDWVDWEIGVAEELHKGVCGVRLKSSHGRTPPRLRELRAVIAGWDVSEIIAVIEQAAARRS